MRRLAPILLFTIAIGWLTGEAWSDFKSGGESKDVPEMAGRQSKSPSRVLSSPRPKLSVENFVQRVNGPVTQADTHPLSDFLAGWTDEQIQHALEECISDPLVNGLPSTNRDSPFQHLIAEWMRRDAAAVETWFHSLESDQLRISLLDVIVENWPGSRPEEGFKFASKVRLPKNFRDEYLLGGSGAFIGPRQEDGDFGRAVAENALQHAAEQGVPQFNALLTLMRTNGVKMPYNLKLPDGFNFVALAAGEELTSLFQKGDATAILHQWKAKHPDEAFRWVRENSSGKLMVEFLDAAPKGFDKPDLQWIGSKFGQLSKQERSLLVEGAAVFLISSTEWNEKLEGSIEDPELKIEHSCNVFLTKFRTLAQPIDEILLEWKEPEARMKILENLEPSSLVDTEHPANLVKGHDEKELRGLMSGWTTDQKRIDSIIERFKR